MKNPGGYIGEALTAEQWRSKSKGRGRSRVPGTMNKTERAYADHLLAIVQPAWFKYEGITLKLGPDCRYTPDFAVMLHDGTIEFHETKGFRRDDAMVKIRAAADAFPFVFRLVERTDGGWRVTEIK